MIDLYPSTMTRIRNVKPFDTSGLDLRNSFHDFRGISSFLHGVENANLDIGRVQNQDDMPSVSLPRAIISTALVLLSVLVISGLYPSGTRYQRTRGKAMASSLKVVTVAPRGKHTATVIFMHVRHHRVLSTPTPSSDTHFCTGIGRFWSRLETNC